MFSTDLGSTNLKCQNETVSSNVTCPEWIQYNLNSLSNGTSGYQYGPGIAYPPKTVMSNLSAGQHLQIISDGRAPLPMPGIWAVDQVGQIVSMPGLEANVTVVNLNPPLPGIQNATLLGQMQAVADADGTFIFNATVLLAAPAMYNLTVSVTEVSFPPAVPKATTNVVQEHVEQMLPPKTGFTTVILFDTAAHITQHHALAT